VEENITLICFAKYDGSELETDEDTVNLGPTPSLMVGYHLVYVGPFSDCHRQEDPAHSIFLAPKHGIFAAVIGYYPWLDRNRLTFGDILVVKNNLLQVVF